MSPGTSEKARRCDLANCSASICATWASKPSCSTSSTGIPKAGTRPNCHQPSGAGCGSSRRCRCNQMSPGPRQKIAKTTPCKVEWTPARGTLAALRPGQEKKKDATQFPHDWPLQIARRAKKDTRSSATPVDRRASPLSEGEVGLLMAMRSIVQSNPGEGARDLTKDRNPHPALRADLSRWER